MATLVSARRISVAKMHHEERDGDVFKTGAPLPSILSHCQLAIVLGAQQDAMMTAQKRKMIVSSPRMCEVTLFGQFAKFESGLVDCGLPL